MRNSCALFHNCSALTLDNDWYSTEELRWSGMIKCYRAIEYRNIRVYCSMQLDREPQDSSRHTTAWLWRFYVGAGIEAHGAGAQRSPKSEPGPKFSAEINLGAGHILVGDGKLGLCPQICGARTASIAWRRHSPLLERKIFSQRR
jgi:hypothetical protein